MTKINLYEITQEFEALDNMLIESGGEITEENEELEQYINGLLMSKVDGCVEYLTSIEDKASLARKRAAELTELARSLENKSENFKGYMLECMKKLKHERVEGRLHYVSIKTNPKTVNITDADKIPAEFVTTKKTTSIDKKALAKSLKNGEKIDGATLVDGKKSLNIK